MHQYGKQAKIRRDFNYTTAKIGLACALSCYKTILLMIGER